MTKTAIMLLSAAPMVVPHSQTLIHFLTRQLIVKAPWTYNGGAAVKI
jgi:hypothetical protein